jgi:hypothetical protein
MIDGDRDPPGRAQPGRARGGMWRGLALGLVIALMMIGCVVHRLTGPRLTGTCEGVCAHYVQCKAGHSAVDRERCTLECPDVFSDRDSLMAYESLSCENAVEYIDGRTAKTANTAKSPAQPNTASTPAQP